MIRAALLAALLLGACKPECPKGQHVERINCHEAHGMMPIYHTVGKMHFTTFMPYTYQDCDRVCRLDAAAAGW